MAAAEEEVVSYNQLMARSAQPPTLFRRQSSDAHASSAALAALDEPQVSPAHGSSTRNTPATRRRSLSSVHLSASALRPGDAQRALSSADTTTGPHQHDSPQNGTISTSSSLSTDDDGNGGLEDKEEEDWGIDMDMTVHNIQLDMDELQTLLNSQDFEQLDREATQAVAGGNQDLASPTSMQTISGHGGLIPSGAGGELLLGSSVSPDPDLAFPPEEDELSTTMVVGATDILEADRAELESFLNASMDDDAAVPLTVSTPLTNGDQQPSVVRFVANSVDAVANEESELAHADEQKEDTSLRLQLPRSTSTTSLSAPSSPSHLRNKSDPPANGVMFSSDDDDEHDDATDVDASSASVEQCAHALVVLRKGWIEQNVMSPHMPLGWSAAPVEERPNATSMRRRFFRARTVQDEAPPDLPPDVLHSKVSNWQQQLSIAVSVGDRLVGLLRDKTSELDSVQEQIIHTKREAELMEEELKSTKKELSAVRKERDNWEFRHDDMQQERDAMAVRLGDMVRSMEASKSSQQTLAETRYNALKVEYRDLSRRHEELKRSRVDAEHMLQAKEIKRLQDELQQARACIKALESDTKNDTADSKAKASSAGPSVPDDENEEIVKLRDEVAHLNASLHWTATQLQEAQQLLEASQDTQATLQRKLDALRLTAGSPVPRKSLASELNEITANMKDQTDRNKDFFMLTVLAVRTRLVNRCVKLKMPRSTVSKARAKDLYAEAMRLRVPFYYYYLWVEKQLDSTGLLSPSSRRSSLNRLPRSASAVGNGLLRSSSAFSSGSSLDFSSAGSPSMPRKTAD